MRYHLILIVPHTQGRSSESSILTENRQQFSRQSPQGGTSQPTSKPSPGAPDSETSPALPSKSFCLQVLIMTTRGSGSRCQRLIPLFQFLLYLLSPFIRFLSLGILWNFRSEGGAALVWQWKESVIKDKGILMSKKN